MITFLEKRQSSLWGKAISAVVALTFIFSTVMPPRYAYAQHVMTLPAPGAMVNLSPAFTPILLKGVKVHPDNPFEFDFLVDTGHLTIDDESLEEESSKIIKYFLASLTVPEDDLWVNLSPYEKDRIISEEFGITEMGRDMLAQDYMLKQLTSSLIYPEDELGQKFWDRVYEKAYKQYGTTDIAVNTFNKVWIVPDGAEVYETGNTAFVGKSKLKVMMEEDYIALRQNLNNAIPLSLPAGRQAQQGASTKKDLGIDEMEAEDVKKLSGLSSSVMKELIIPEIEKEINEGKNFAQLRQIYNSLILAAWYKQALKQTILAQIYVDKKKVEGVDLEDKEAKEKIYKQYLEAYKKGVYNFIKEDYDPYREEMIPRKYFSGGLEFMVKPVVTPVSPVDASKLVIKSITGSAADVYVNLMAPATNRIELDAIVVNGEKLRLVRLTKELLIEKVSDFTHLINLVTADVEPYTVEDVIKRADNPEKFDEDLSFAVLDSQGKAVGLSINVRTEKEDTIHGSKIVVDPKYQGSVVAPWVFYRALSEAHTKYGYTRMHGITAVQNDPDKKGSERKLAFHTKIGGKLDTSVYPDGIIPPREDADIKKVSHYSLVYDLPETLAKLKGDFQYKLLKSIVADINTSADASLITKPNDLIGGGLNREYLERISEIINLQVQRESKRTSALYVGPGADISTVYLATDADEYVFVDQLPFYPKRELEEREYMDYVDEKAGGISFAQGAQLRDVGGVWPFLKLELDTLGAEGVEVNRREDNPKIFDVTFNLNGRDRKIVYVSETDATYIEDYAQVVAELGGVDTLFVKSSEEFRMTADIQTEEIEEVTDMVNRLVKVSGHVVVDIANAKPAADYIARHMEIIEDERTHDPVLRALEAKGAHLGYIKTKAGAYIYKKISQDPAGTPWLTTYNLHERLTQFYANVNGRLRGRVTYEGEDVQAPDHRSFRYRFRTLTSELVQNALDEQAEGKIRISLKQYAAGFIFSVTNDGEFDWNALRRAAEDAARNGALVFALNQFRVDERMGRTFPGSRLSVEDVEDIRDEDLPYVVGLTRGKSRDSGEYGGQGAGLVYARSLAKSIGGNLRIGSGNGETTVSVVLVKLPSRERLRRLDASALTEWKGTLQDKDLDYTVKVTRDKARILDVINKWESEDLSKVTLPVIVKRSIGFISTIENDNGTVLGFSYVRVNPNVIGENLAPFALEHIEVSPELRGSGLGEILIAKSIEQALATDLPTLSEYRDILTVHPAEDTSYRDEGKRARDFFYGLGFSEIEREGFTESLDEDAEERELYLNLSIEKAEEILEKVKAEVVSVQQRTPSQLRFDFDRDASVLTEMSFTIELEREMIEGFDIGQYVKVNGQRRYLMSPESNLYAISDKNGLEVQTEVKNRVETLNLLGIIEASKLMSRLHPPDELKGQSAEEIGKANPPLDAKLRYSEAHVDIVINGEPVYRFVRTDPRNVVKISDGEPADKETADLVYILAGTLLFLDEEIRPRIVDRTGEEIFEKLPDEIKAEEIVYKKDVVDFDYLTDEKPYGLDLLGIHVEATRNVLENVDQIDDRGISLSIDAIMMFLDPRVDKIPERHRQYFIDIMTSARKQFRVALAYKLLDKDLDGRSVEKEVERISNLAYPIVKGVPTVPKKKDADASALPVIRPLVSNAIDRVKLQEWIDAHPDDMKRVAQFIADNITEVSMEEFLGNLDRSIQEFNTNIGEEEYLVQPFQSRSPRWVYELALERGLKPALDEGEDNLAQTLAKHPDLKNILIIDDASFSGAQISDEGLYTSNAMQEILGDKVKIQHHVLVPYMTDLAYHAIRDYNTDKEFTFYRQEKIYTLENLLEGQDQDIRDIITSNYAHPTELARLGLTKFAWNLPDNLMGYDADEDAVPVVRSLILFGPVLDRQGNTLRHVRFQQNIPEPYKPDYQQWIMGHHPELAEELEKYKMPSIDASELTPPQRTVNRFDRRSFMKKFAIGTTALTVGGLGIWKVSDYLEDQRKAAAFFDGLKQRYTDVPRADKYIDWMKTRFLDRETAPSIEVYRRNQSNPFTNYRGNLDYHVLGSHLGSLMRYEMPYDLLALVPQEDVDLIMSDNELRDGFIRAMIGKAPSIDALESLWHSDLPLRDVAEYILDEIHDYRPLLRDVAAAVQDAVREEHTPDQLKDRLDAIVQEKRRESADDFLTGIYVLRERDAQKMLTWNLFTAYTAQAAYGYTSTLLGVTDDMERKEIVDTLMNVTHFIDDSSVLGHVNIMGGIGLNVRPKVGSIYSTATHEAVHRIQYEGALKQQFGLARSSDIQWLLSSALGDFNNLHMHRYFGEEAARHGWRTRSEVLLKDATARKATPLETHSHLRSIPGGVSNWMDTVAHIQTNKGGRSFGDEPWSSYVEGERLAVYAATHYGEAGALLLRLYATQYEQMNFAQMELAAGALKEVLDDHREASLRVHRFELEERIISSVQEEADGESYNAVYSDLENTRDRITAAVVAALPEKGRGKDPSVLTGLGVEGEWFQNYIGDGEKPVINLDGYKDQRVIQWRTGDGRLQPFLEQDQKELEEIAREQSVSRGEDITPQDILEEITDRMTELLTEALKVDSVVWRSRDLRHYVPVKKPGMLSRLARIGTGDDVYKKVGEQWYRYDSQEYEEGYADEHKKQMRDLSLFEDRNYHVLMTRSFLGRPDVTITYRDSENPKQFRVLRLNNYSLQLAKMGVFQKGEPSDDVYTPMPPTGFQTYPVSPRAFYERHVANRPPLYLERTLDKDETLELFGVGTEIEGKIYYNSEANVISSQKLEEMIDGGQNLTFTLVDGDLRVSDAPTADASELTPDRESLSKDFIELRNLFDLQKNTNIFAASHAFSNGVNRAFVDFFRNLNRGQEVASFAVGSTSHGLITNVSDYEGFHIWSDEEELEGRRAKVAAFDSQMYRAGLLIDDSSSPYNTQFIPPTGDRRNRKATMFLGADRQIHPGFIFFHLDQFERFVDSVIFEAERFGLVEVSNETFASQALIFAQPMGQFSEETTSKINQLIIKLFNSKKVRDDLVAIDRKNLRMRDRINEPVESLDEASDILSDDIKTRKSARLGERSLLRLRFILKMLEIEARGEATLAYDRSNLAEDDIPSNKLFESFLNLRADGEPIITQKNLDQILDFQKTLLHIKAKVIDGITPEKVIRQMEEIRQIALKVDMGVDKKITFADASELTGEGDGVGVDVEGVSAEIMELYKVGDSKKFRTTLRDIGIVPDDLIPAVKGYTEQYLREKILNTVFKPFPKSAQKRVFQHESLDFVVGFEYGFGPDRENPPPTNTLPASYSTAYERGGDVVGNVFYLQDVTLKYVDYRGKEMEVFVPYLLVQERLTEFGKKIRSLEKERTDEAKELIRDLYQQFIELHRRMYSRGFLNWDVKIAVNYGVTRDNKVVLLDTGGITKDKREPLISWYVPAPIGTKEPDYKNELSLAKMEKLWETDLDGALRSTFVNPDLEEPLGEIIKKAVKKAVNSGDDDLNGKTSVVRDNSSGDPSRLTGSDSDASELTEEAPVGGIDFTPAGLNLKIRRDKDGIPVPLTPQQLETINIDGLVPVIINITPITNIPMFLGAVNREEEKTLELSLK